MMSQGGLLVNLWDSSLLNKLGKQGKQEVTFFLKYLQGENITPLTRNQVKESLDLIQQDTGISFHNAEIYNPVIALLK